ncbi:MAG: hypothetical protein AB7S26_29910 [Sandaracinaceae bacterium]
MRFCLLLSPILAGAVLAGAVLVGGPMRAAAQAGRGGEEEALRRANEQLASGDAPGAIETLRAAQAEAPSPRIELSLATALAANGQNGRAVELLRELVESDANPLVRDAAEEMLAQLTPRIATVDVSADSSVRDARFFVDGRRRSRSLEPITLPLEPGHHEIEARTADGDVLARASVDVVADETATVTLRGASPEPAASTSPRPLALAESAASSPRAPAVEVAVDEPASEPSPPEWAWWVIAGGAGVLVITTLAIVLAVGLPGPSPTMGDAPPIFVGRM